MTRDEISTKVRDILIDELAVDEDDVTEQSSLVKDLGAESIDFLAIVFKLEQAFGFKIGQGELFPENVTQDPKFVQNGRVTPEGMSMLKGRLPHVDFAKFEGDPQVAKVAEVFTVDTLVRFVEKKLKA
jgi:acyl carrier protein